MKCWEVIEKCRELAPESLACDWDNPGFQAGRSDKEVRRILLAVDVTDEVIDEAVRKKAGMIITHHPLIFHGIRKVSDRDFVGKRILRMIQADISYYAMHTNFDAAPGCMGDAAAERLSLTGCAILDPMGTMADGRPYGIGAYGKLPREMTLRETAEFVKERFGIPQVQVFGDLSSDRKMRTAAICPGSGGSDIANAVRSGAEVYVTGDISHHQGLDALEQGLSVIDAGHYGIEHIFMPVMKAYLEKVLPGEVEISAMPEHFPMTAV